MHDHAAYHRMMTLIGLAITIAYVYSSAVVFGLEGRFFFWELATLVDVMLAGHWIETRSVLSTSAVLEKLARLMPDVAHRKHEGKAEDIPLSEVKKGDILIRSFYVSQNGPEPILGCGV